MAFTLTWLAGRSTPVVTRTGEKRRETAGGRVIASRRATAEEAAQIRKGVWIRSRPPGDPNKRSSVRPALAAKQKDAGPGLWENIRRKRARIKNGAKERKARPGEADFPEAGALKRSKAD